MERDGLLDVVAGSIDLSEPSSSPRWRHGCGRHRRRRGDGRTNGRRHAAAAPSDARASDVRAPDVRALMGDLVIGRVRLRRMVGRAVSIAVRARAAERAGGRRGSLRRRMGWRVRRRRKGRVRRGRDRRRRGGSAKAVRGIKQRKSIESSARKQFGNVFK